MLEARHTVGVIGDAKPSTAPSTSDSEAPPRGDRLGLEVLAVLSVSYAMSGLYALLSFIRAQVTINHGIGFSGVATAPLNRGRETEFQWLDILDHLADVVSGLAPAFLAIVLLLRSPGGRGLGVGLDRLRTKELFQGFGFAAAIGIPGLALVYAARELGFNAQIVATDFDDVWYRIPVLLLNAFQNGAAEEVIVTAYLLTRLRQLGWTSSRSVAAAAVLRGSYHLYQGYGAFVGNAVMGVIFGWWFQRTRRIVPLIVAHTVIDAVSFIGYIYLHGKVSWL